ncbi:MAG TPA: hypothetical protein VKM55_14315 [Candidatus Lokiarchaeia archaeon]|nr:hypothetical protein [Candidatus Lokiarchaeia archaeon]
MALQDLLDVYVKKLASIYPNNSMDPPSSIEIGPVKLNPLGSINFGITKDDGTWIIPEQYESVAVPILAREAYLAGFPEKARASKSIQHACNWFAFKEIKDKTMKRKFLDWWLIASQQGEASNDIYALPPVLMQEFDKCIGAPAAELHDLLLRFTNENERLLKHQLRIDVAETWGLAKSIEYLPSPDPTTIAILHASASMFMETAELPGKKAILDYIDVHPFFGAIPRSRIDKEFPRAQGLFHCQYQFDASWIGKKYVLLVFMPSPRFKDLDWGTMFSIPGVFVRLNWYQGDMLGESQGMPRTAIAWFMLPNDAVDSFVDLVRVMHQSGMFAAHDVLVDADVMAAVNYNTYVVDEARPRFTIDPIKDEPGLFLSRVIERKGDSAAFLAKFMQDNPAKMRAFIDKLASSFSIKAGRHDSWYQVIAEIAGIHERTAARWLDLLTWQHPVLVPEPRTTYYFHSTIPVTARLEFTTRSTMTAREQQTLAKAFPATSRVGGRSIDRKDSAIWNVLVPPGQVEAAIDLVSGIEPSARIALHVANLHDTFGTMHSLLHWFDGTGYDQLTPFIEACTAAVPGLASGTITTAQFRHACHDPAQVALDDIAALK